MDSRLIFLHSVRRLNRAGRCSEVWPTTRIEGARKGEADLLLKHTEMHNREKPSGDNVRTRTKTDTGGRGEYPNGARENGP